MKRIDYRTPWGRPSEHILAVKQEIVNQQMHIQRVKDAKTRGMINMEPPDCVYMPHLINRLKKKKVMRVQCLQQLTKEREPHRVIDRLILLLILFCVETLSSQFNI